MKAITTTLYVCGSLMTAAAVIGLIDYRSAKNNGTFNKLYREEPASPAVAAKKVVELEDYSRGEINRPDDKAPVAVVQTEKVKKGKANMAGSVKKRKKKISFEKFSRAAIEERLVLVDSTVKRK